MRVWFNHWFSTAYHFINMVKEAGYYVIATNERDTCVYQVNADEFYIEPVFNDEDAYIDWCLEFCKEHRINVFFVKRGSNTIVKRLEEFELEGIKVICEKNIEMFDILKVKTETMKFFQKHNICKVPEMRVVTNANEFEVCYNLLKDKYEQLCIKYDSDEGGMSYKLIQDREPNIDRITENFGLAYSYDYILNCLNTVDEFKPLVIMPYLNGSEISIDCLSFGDELIAIPRYKLSNRVTQFDMDEKLIEIAKKFQAVAKLEGPYNIQLRYHNDELYLLEVNTRLSGGSWKAKFMGCEFPVLCIKKFTNKLKNLPTIKKDKLRVSNIESCVELN